MMIEMKKIKLFIGIAAWLGRIYLLLYRSVCRLGD